LHRLNVVRLRVATLNVWAIPLLSERIGTRMREIGRRLAPLELDAIAFQEAWTPAARRHLIDAGRQAGLGNAWHRKRLILGSGLLVLSRLPIEGADFDRFTLRACASAKDELLGGKGFARVVLGTPEGRLVLVDTHLHAGTANEGEVGTRAQRTAQIVQLAAEVRELPEPVLVIGDLNCQDNDPEHVVLTGLTGLRDLAAETGSREPTALRNNPYRRGSPKPDRRIDYVMARDGDRVGLRSISVARIFDEPFAIDGREAACSDHAGVCAELEIGAAARSGSAPADSAALDLAARLLGEGAATARRNRRDTRTGAAIGLGAAALAATGSRALRSTRRRFLGGALSLGALAALAPGVERSLSSEWLVPNEIDAFGQAAVLLARIRAESIAAGLA